MTLSAPFKDKLEKMKHANGYNIEELERQRKIDKDGISK